MDTRTIDNSLKTAALVFSMNSLVMFFFRDNEACSLVASISTMLLIGYLNDESKKSIQVGDIIFKRQGDNFYGSPGQAHVLFQLNEDAAERLLEEKSQLRNIPRNVIEGGAKLFDTMTSCLINTAKYYYPIKTADISSAQPPVIAPKSDGKPIYLTKSYRPKQ